MSPECTWHSRARGRKTDTGTPDLFGETLPSEAAERSRATMWDVVRFTEHHSYEHVIVENVVEIRDWPPYRAWLLAMDALGYEHHEVFLNSMHAQVLGLPAPQSRDRIYVNFWRRGNRRPDFTRWQRPRAWCPSCGEIVESVQTWKRPGRPWGRYRSQYVYRCPKHSCRGQIVEPGWLPAAAAINWALPGTRIGDRARPLREKTRRRIAVGIALYWQPFMLDRRFEYRSRPLTAPLSAVTANDTAKALAVPVEGRDGKVASPVDVPMRTMTTRAETALAWPFIAELRGGGSTARSTSEPLATVTASGFHHGLVAPYYGNSDTAVSTEREQPIGTLTTRGRYALIMRNADNRGDLAAAEAQVDDCLFRMLEPAETAAGMAFPGDYRWQGTRRERQRLAGNAVTPPVARDLIGCAVEALGGTT